MYSENATNDENDNLFHLDPFFPLFSLRFLTIREPSLFTGFTDSSFTGFEIVSFASVGCFPLFFLPSPSDNFAFLGRARHESSSPSSSAFSTALPLSRAFSTFYVEVKSRMSIPINQHITQRPRVRIRNTPAKTSPTPLSPSAQPAHPQSKTQQSTSPSLSSSSPPPRS